MSRVIDSYPETKEFFEAINKVRLVGNGFKEVASLRVNDKTYSDNSNQIDWGNNDKTVQVEVEDNVIKAVKEIVEDVKIESEVPVVISVKEEKILFLKKFLKLWE